MTIYTINNIFHYKNQTSFEIQVKIYKIFKNHVFNRIEIDLSLITDKTDTFW